MADRIPARWSKLPLDPDVIRLGEREKHFQATTELFEPSLTDYEYGESYLYASRVTLIGRLTLGFAWLDDER